MGHTLVVSTTDREMSVNNETVSRNMLLIRGWLIASLLAMADPSVFARPQDWPQVNSISDDLSDGKNATEGVDLSDSVGTIFTMDHIKEPNYFEGDLNVTQDVINAFYKTAGRDRFTRAVRRDKDMLWPRGIVHYEFHGSLNGGSQRTIHSALREIEQLSCVRFFPLEYQSDYVEFTGKGDTCLSSIGKVGGEQLINLPQHCRNRGIILHEVLHALGIWHEQSRPDRDMYVEVLKENIETGREQNFQARRSTEVDHYGERYDYGSIMHYSFNAFSSNGHPTLRIINMNEYVRQGQPLVGQRQRLSRSDIIQLNRMYNCPGSGVTGNLNVYIKSGRGFNTFVGQPNIYINVTAVDDKNEQVTHFVQYLIEGERNPRLDEWIAYGRSTSWQHIEVSIWNSSHLGSYHPLTDVETVSINPGYYKNLRYCGGESCSVRVYFAYNLAPYYGNEDCKNITCSAKLCPCQENDYGTFKIYIRYGGHLLNESTDSGFPFTNPYYVVITVYNSNGANTSLLSTAGHEKNDELIKWNQWLDFGVGSWVKFDIDIVVYNENFSSHRPLSNTTTYYLDNYASRKFIQMELEAFYVYFDYFYLPIDRKNETWTVSNHQESYVICHPLKLIYYYTFLIVVDMLLLTCTIEFNMII